VNLKGARLNGAILTSANLQSAKLDEALISGAIFAKADLTMASLGSARGASVNFSGALLRQVNLESSRLIAANFRGAQMDRSNLSKSDLQASDLRNAVMKEANVTGADLSGARYNRATVLPFPRSEATAIGMVLDRAGSLLVIPEPNNPWLGNLLGSLHRQEITATVSYQSTQAFTGEIDLSEYSSILHINNNDLGTEMPAKGQEALVNFVKAGGTYITLGSMSFAIAQNVLARMKDLSLMTFRSFLSNQMMLVSSGASVGHPLLDGFEGTINMGYVNYAQGQLTTFSEYPAKTLLSDSSGNPIVMTRDFHSGQVVHFAVCSSGDSNCILVQPLQKMIANGARWATQRPAFVKRL
jgi:hypothetical protein